MLRDMLAYVGLSTAAANDDDDGGATKVEATTQPKIAAVSANILEELHEHRAASGPSIRIVIRGARRTGKTSLLQRLQNGNEDISRDYIPTQSIQAGMTLWRPSTTTAAVAIGEPSGTGTSSSSSSSFSSSLPATRVELWDVVDRGTSTTLGCSSSEKEVKHSAIAAAMSLPTDATTVDVYRGCHGVVFMLDATSRETFTHVQEEVKRLPPHIPFVVCSNFQDTVREDPDRQEVSEDDVRLWLATVPCVWSSLLSQIRGVASSGPGCERGGGGGGSGDSDSDDSSTTSSIDHGRSDSAHCHRRRHHRRSTDERNKKAILKKKKSETEVCSPQPTTTATTTTTTTTAISVTSDAVGVAVSNINVSQRDGRPVVVAAAEKMSLSSPPASLSSSSAFHVRPTFILASMRNGFGVKPLYQFFGVCIAFARAAMIEETLRRAYEQLHMVSMKFTEINADQSLADYLDWKAQEELRKKRKRVMEGHQQHLLQQQQQQNHSTSVPVFASAEGSYQAPSMKQPSVPLTEDRAAHGIEQQHRYGVDHGKSFVNRGSTSDGNAAALYNSLMGGGGGDVGSAIDDSFFDGAAASSAVVVEEEYDRETHIQLYRNEATTPPPPPLLPQTTPLSSSSSFAGGDIASQKEHNQKKRQQIMEKLALSSTLGSNNASPPHHHHHHHHHHHDHAAGAPLGLHQSTQASHAGIHLSQECIQALASQMEAHFEEQQQQQQQLQQQQDEVTKEG